MYQHRLIRFAALAVVIGALAAPTVSARVPDLQNADNRRAVATEQRKDLRSADAADAAAGRGTFSAPEVVVVKVREPQPEPVADGIDWNDAGLGAGAFVGLSLVLVGGGVLIVHRRHAHAAYAS